MVRPRALAVLRLMTNSIFVGCWTGRSAGFSPLYGALEVKHLFSRILHFLHFLHTSFFVRVRRETGKKSVVRVHHGEGVAIHIGPESCADAREGSAKRRLRLLTFPIPKKAGLAQHRQKPTRRGACDR